MDAEQEAREVGCSGSSRHRGKDAQEVRGGTERLLAFHDGNSCGGHPHKDTLPSLTPP